MPRPRKLVYDYYRITVPGDCAESIEDLADIAINEAREQAALYCIPCDWQATHVSGEVGDWNVVFRVRRRRNYVPKKGGKRE